MKTRKKTNETKKNGNNEKNIQNGKSKEYKERRRGLQHA